VSEESREVEGAGAQFRAVRAGDAVMPRPPPASVDRTGGRGFWYLGESGEGRRGERRGGWVRLYRIFGEAPGWMVPFDRCGHRFSPGRSCRTGQGRRVSGCVPLGEAPDVDVVVVYCVRVGLTRRISSRSG
jgi:hypothetical protein